MTFWQSFREKYALGLIIALSALLGFLAGISTIAPMAAEVCRDGISELVEKVRQGR